jgi:hypothetical protein
MQTVEDFINASQLDKKEPVSLTGISVIERKGLQIGACDLPEVVGFNHF